ncbi:ComF family protein [Modestobacter sp. URMC 112]
MPIDLQEFHPPPAGFNACRACVYWTTGSPAICYPCSSTGVEVAAAATCGVCGQALEGGAGCPNAVCTLEDRYFSRIHTVSPRTEEMWDAVMDYKYADQRGWADVLGRVLVGFLGAHGEEMRRFDVITTGAIHIGPQAPRLWDYLQLIVEAAARQGPEWPFAPGLIAKSRPTGRFLGISPQERREIAEGELRAALSVPEPERVAGRRVLVFDDIYSEGYSLREMARVLREAGAVEVAGLVLARRKGG